MNSWAGKRVLVTGADGFIGSHVTEALVRAGAKVRAFCVYNSFNSHGWLDPVNPEFHPHIEFRLGDIRDARFVEASCREIDVVFHLAALIAIPYSYVAAESFVDTNVKGTLHVLEAARRAGCSRVVHTSTSEVYGTPDSLPITETHALKGQSPYSASKIAADKLCEAYHCSYGTPVVTLRPFNTYGPRQSLRALIPTILAQLLAGRATVRLGDLTPKRDFTFVTDTAKGFLAAGLAPNVEGQVIQLGTGRAESVATIFELAQRACGSKASLESAEERIRPAASEVRVLQSNPQRAADLLGWKSVVELEEGIKETVEWLRPRVDRSRPDAYVI